MLYICLPSHNEAETVGVLLWRIRKVFADYSREYEVLVYDDASTDSTRDTLAPYGKVMPLTVLGSHDRVGYARAVDALLRAANERTRYPRRDAVVLMQADFTDQPEHLPELVKRFEGGADFVVTERLVDESAPEGERKRLGLLRRLNTMWPFRSFVGIPGIADPFGAYRLIRLAVVRELLKTREVSTVVDVPVSAANADLAREIARHSRRVETVQLSPCWDLRSRPTRATPWRDAVAVAKRGWATRALRAPARVRST
ncbi:MAG: glycosyltransferase family 2 protein [Gemmatimonadetes bacterium]|nr:glycosyltransferase family 2 protein [Gemmatimonadota bacterium]